MFKLADLVKVGADKAEEKLDLMEVELTAESHTRKSLEESKALVEQFLPGDKTLDPLIAKLKQFLIAIKHDQKLADHLHHWREYIETGFKQPAKITTNEYLKQGEELSEEAFNLDISKKLNDSGKAVYDEWKDVISNFKADENLNMLSSTLKKLMDDVTKTDEVGRTKIDIEALARLRPIIVEVLKANLDRIPLPDVMGEDDDYQWKAWNLVAHGEEILPDFIRINTSTKSQAAIGDLTKSSFMKGDLIVKIENIRTKLDNVNFWYNKKSFPKSEDTGSMDVDVAGGITIIIKLTMEVNDKQGGLMFNGGSVVCRADDVKVKIRDTKHDILFNLFSGTWESRVQKSIETFIAQKLAGAIGELKDAANERVKEVQKASLQAVLPDAIAHLTA